MTVSFERMIEPEKKLAKLIETVTGLQVDAAKVKSLVADHWSAVQAYAHAIHENDIIARALRIHELETGAADKTAARRGPNGNDRPS